MDYKNIKTNPKMNETVKDMLKLNDDNYSLYALKRIEELEQLILSGVSHRRELLLDFLNVLDINNLLEPNIERITIDDIDEYLKI